MPIERSRSERSFGGSFSSLGFGSIFGFDDELDAEVPNLSEYQQQSLSVFESEHMWAHFKAQLEENNIYTTAGVRAMLPEFVNNRVVDGSVHSSEQQESTLSRSLSSTGTSILSEREGTLRRRNNRKIYPAAMRRQESFGKNMAKYGDMLRRSDSSLTSDHGIDSYHQAIRGDADNVISLYSSEIENDDNLLRSVSKRLSQMTTLNSDSFAKRRISRSNSVFSVSPSTLEKDYSSYAIDMSVAQIRLGQSVTDNNQSSRPKFRRPSLTTEDEDIPDEDEDQLPQVTFNNSRRLSQSSQELVNYFGEVVGLPLPDDEEDNLEECPQKDTFRPASFVYQPKRTDETSQDHSENVPSLDESKAAMLPTTTYEVDTFAPKSFTYEPKRNCVTSSIQNPNDPDIIDTKNDVASIPYSCENKNEEAVSSFNTSDTLLVEWGEGDSESECLCSEDERHSDVDSERAVVIGRDDRICANNEGEGYEGCQGERPSPTRLRIMSRMMASLVSEKSRKR